MFQSYLDRLKLPQELFLTFVHTISVRPKLRKVERRLVPVLEMLSVDELMETNTYQKFNKLIESVFETIEDDVIITDEMGKYRIPLQIKHNILFTFKDMYTQKHIMLEPILPHAA